MGNDKIVPWNRHVTFVGEYRGRETCEMHAVTGCLCITIIIQGSTGVSNRWTTLWNGIMEWKIEWNGEYTQL